MDNTAIKKQLKIKAGAVLRQVEVPLHCNQSDNDDTFIGLQIGQRKWTLHQRGRDLDSEEE